MTCCLLLVGMVLIQSIQLSIGQISIDTNLPTDAALYKERKAALTLRQDPLHSISADMPQWDSITKAKLQNPDLPNIRGMPDGMEVENLADKETDQNKRSGSVDFFAGDQDKMPDGLQLKTPERYVAGGNSMLVGLSGDQDPMHINVS